MAFLISKRLVEKQKGSVATKHALELKERLGPYPVELKLEAINVAIERFAVKNPENLGALIYGLRKAFPEISDKIRFGVGHDIELKVLSADDAISMHNTRRIMEGRGFEVMETAGEESRRSNLKGIKTYTSILRAREEKQEIEIEAGADILEIKMRLSH
ncbi:MAG: hypothetical protein KGH71_01470 [Candidatus Micrarchaeota archaeon]|nr:hypothetical protein [Candidatus Micrarchaeota archaeon]